MPPNTTLHIQRCLDRLRAGDPAARAELIRVASDRLTRLARKMLRADGRLRRWEDTGDVSQGAAVRLYRALGQVNPATPREFIRLAALLIRRELIDLARHHYGPAGQAASHQTPSPEGRGKDEPAHPSEEPSELAAWGEFHECIGALPEEEREVFDLVWYQGRTHAEAAELLDVSKKTVQRRWHAACLHLREALGGELPGP